MILRTVGLSVTLCLLVAPLAADAQQPAKVPRIGYLGPSSPSTAPDVLEAFRQGLHELGCVEGQKRQVV